MPASIEACFSIGDSTEPRHDASAGHDGAFLDGGTFPDGHAGSGGADASAEACAPAPSGWTYVAYQPTPNAACPSGYGNPLTLGEGLVDPGCSCSCDPPSGVECWQQAIGFSTQQCNGGSQIFAKQAPPGQCVDVSSAAAVTLQLLAQGGSCAAHDAPIAATYSSTVTICSAEGVCPAAAPGSRCVLAQSGNPDCPPGFGVKHSLGQGINDDRSCGGCSCGAPADVVCDTSSLAVCQLDCSGCVGTGFLPGCRPYGPQALAFGATATGGSCTAGASSTVSGSVSPATPSVVCCES